MAIARASSWLSLKPTSTGSSICVMIFKQSSLRAPGRQQGGGLGDGLGPDGISARVLDVTRNVVKIQTGYLYHYAFAMLIGAAGLITWFMFGFGGQ